MLNKVVMIFQIGGYHSVSGLDGEDCYNVGLAAYSMEDYGHSAQWFTLATTMHTQLGETANFPITNALFNLGYSLYQVI